MKKLLLICSVLFLGACSTSGEGSTPNPDPGNPTQPMFSCQNPIGGVVEHGQGVVLFKDQEVAFGQACVSENRVCNNGVLSGTAAFATCDVLPEAEPASHEKPLAISEAGLKRGGIKKMGTDRKVYGWVYEKHSLTEYSPLANVRVEFFRYTDCMLWPKKCHKGEVFTDKWGYFEYVASETLHDTFSTKSPEGYYGYCSGKDMIYVMGSNYAYGKPEGQKAFGALHHSKIVDADICLK